MALPITVLLAEDHIIMRQGLSALLAQQADIQLVGEARTGREAIQLARELRPDVVLMDIAMPVLNGLEATKQILQANPAARILILSAHSDDAYIKRLHEAGVYGFLDKQTSVELLARSIRDVAKGRRSYSPAIARRLGDFLATPAPLATGSRREPGRLTHRESEVLQLVAEGSANKQIADHLGISIKTVEKHRQHLMDKLRIHDTAGLTRYAISSGVIESSVQSTFAAET